MARRLGLGAFRVQAWGGGHIEPFGSAYPFRIVNQYERGRFILWTVYARRAVGFVAKNEVKRRGAVVLRALHKGKRVVGAENHRHRVAGSVSQRFGNGAGIGRDRNFEFLQRGVLVVSPSARVGTDADIAMRNRLLLRPFPHGLLE